MTQKYLFVVCLLTRPHHILVFMLYMRTLSHTGIRLNSPASRLFIQRFIEAQIKEDIKAPRNWPLYGEFTGHGEFRAQRASYAENISIWWRHHGEVHRAHASCSPKLPLNENIICFTNWLTYHVATNLQIFKCIWKQRKCFIFIEISANTIFSIHVVINSYAYPAQWYMYIYGSIDPP